MFMSVFGRQESPQLQPPPQAQLQPTPQALASSGAYETVGNVNPLSRQSPEHNQLYSPSGAAGKGPVGLPIPAQSERSMAASGPPPAHPARRHFPELANMSTEELRLLLTDANEYAKFLHKVEEVRQLDKVVEDLQKSNVDLAKSTLALEGTISELQNQCRIIRGTELAAGREQLQQLLARQQEVYSKLGPSALVARLQEGAKIVSKESEVLQAQLSDGEIDSSAFIKEYKTKRALYHLRNQTSLAALASFASNPR